MSQQSPREHYGRRADGARAMRVAEWECGCITRDLEWDSSKCTGATHGAGNGARCTQSPLDHPAYRQIRDDLKRRATS